ncbi:hypothetical protein [Acidiphilium multivorum]|uniref:hypothetical protein n=1 Tax=Acidiphilium multivorum TaxID=62140 RepID=UPI001B8B2711|nr:hypothetical protein [Acidiphilium multivorum]MBS3025346.1 hypothetical protein [Acidiphilium multivorum]
MSGGLPAFVAGIPDGPLPGIGRSIQARLQQVFPPAKFEFGIVPANVTAKQWNKLTVRTPFIGLGWTMMQDRTESPLFKGICAWNVFIAVMNERGLKERYFGDAQAPGLLHLAQIAVAAVNGMKTTDAGGNGLGSVFVRRVANAHGENFDENQAIAVLDLEVVTTIQAADVIPNPADLGLFQTLAIDWNFTGASSATDLNDVAGIPVTMESS